MQLPQRLARFNRHVTNPIQRLWAGRIPAHGILEHVGRRSGKSYRTPLMAFSADIGGRPGVAVLLSYGPNRDWLKNISAANGGRMRRYGKTFAGLLALPPAELESLPGLSFNPRSRPHVRQLHEP